MSTNYLTAAITAYEALSDREKELFYQVIYREETQDCCSAEEPKEVSEDEDKIDMKKALEIYIKELEKIPNISKPSLPNPITSPTANPWDSIKNKPPYSFGTISLADGGRICGFGLYDRQFSP